MKRWFWILLLAFAPHWVGVCHAAESNPQPTKRLSVYAYSEAPARRTFFYSTSGSSGKLLAFRKRLIARGARRVNCFLPNVVVCDLPLDEDIVGLMTDPDIVLEPAPAPVKQTAGLDLVTGDVFSMRWVQSLYATAGQVFAQAPPATGDGPEIIAREAVEVAPRDVVERTHAAAVAGPAGAQARNILQNSEILIGDILVQLVLPESAANPAYRENWDAASLSQAVSQATLSMLYYQEHFNDLPINFVFKTFERVHTNTEPIQFAKTDEATWVADVMSTLGYNDGPAYYLDTVHRLNEDGRNQAGTDWAFTSFIVNAQQDEDHIFGGGALAAWTWLGGPYSVVAFPPGVPLKRAPLNFFDHFKHQAGHIFWGLDEDRFDKSHICGMHSGYLNFDHGNKVFKWQEILGGIARQGCGEKGGVVPCIMNNQWQGDPCWYTLGHFGLVDANANRVPDALDIAPWVDFENSAVETVTTTHTTVRFVVRSRGVPNKNPFQDPAERVKYSVPIKSVWRTENGVVVQRLKPKDGEVDDNAQNFEFDVGPLRSGLTEIGIETRNTANSRQGFAKQIYYLGLTYVHFAFDFRAVGTNVENLITWNMLGDTFNATLDLHRINVETGADEIVRDHLDPAGPRDGPFTPFGYVDADVKPGRTYRYYVQGEFTSSYKGTETTFVNKSSEHEITAMIPIASKQLLSNVSPNPFRDVAFVSVDVPPSFAFADEGTTFREPVPTAVDVAVYDVAGRLVKKLYDDRMFSRVLTLAWDGTNRRNNKVPSGVYFIKATAGEFRAVRKVALIR